MIIISQDKEDISWADEFFRDTPVTIVNKGDPLSTSKFVLATPNFGKEASAYINYIVTHYDNLPRVNAFVHAHRRTVIRTSDCDIVPILTSLNWQNVTGYYSFQRSEYNYNLGRELQMASLPMLNISELWREHVEPYTGGMPADGIIVATAFAQFAVHRSRIQHFPRRTWEVLLNASLDPGWNAQVDVGRFFEHIWSFLLDSHDYGLYVNAPPFGKRCSLEPPPAPGRWIPSYFHDCDEYMRRAREYNSCAYMANLTQQSE